MCGIAGIFSLNGHHAVDEQHIRQMLGMIRHRGPDEFGMYHDPQIGLGSARLSIIDLSGGQQPITNEDNTCWIVFNGEIFNYVELRPQLEELGHRFRTHSDTEVILHLYEEYGVDCLSHLNGQFAFSIWDEGAQRLFCARDRVGIRPLFYAINDGMLVFASEIKALLASSHISAEIDPSSMDEIFTFWSVQTPNTVFKDIYEIPAGHFLLAQDGQVQVDKFWSVDFTKSDEATKKSIDEYADELRDLLIDATRIRLRADVPVAAYLSGGLDSSLITTIIRNYTNSPLDTFSITFDDPDFDESHYQVQMAKAIGTQHRVVHIKQEDIGAIFPDVIWHTETPILRTSPAPMYLLSKLVNDHHFKVVMTGEGADEFFGGYNIFKETMLRRFWAKHPDSTIRPMLLQRLYPYIAGMSPRNTAFFQAFFKQGLTDTDSPTYSHDLRWSNTQRLKRFLSDNLQASITQTGMDATAQERIPLPDRFTEWSPLERAQYLEITTFMSQYLLSSQGDRMGMANSVEGRYPFLDYRVMHFANLLPPDLKLRNMTEKFLLKHIGKDWLPTDIWKRPKQPYRAPIHRSFFHDATPDYVHELLSNDKLSEYGLFNGKAVEQLINKIQRGGVISETDNMALAGILSAQLVHHQFITDFRVYPAITQADNLKVCDRTSV